jgi:hypothetical protein
MMCHEREITAMKIQIEGAGAVLQETVPAQ